MLCYRLMFVLGLHSAGILGDDEVDIKGPIMPKKADGTLFNTAELIEERKYKAETHHVVTEDGYVLKLFRVMSSKEPGSAVLIQHGFLASSDALVTDPDALAFKMSNAGFDVWLNNARGNYYSRNHTTLNPDTDKAFWDFSWHEMGMKDIPAAIDYILKTTGQSKVHYIGHSAGTVIGLVMTSLKPQYNEKLKSLVLLSPLAMLSKMFEMFGPDGVMEEIATKYMDEFMEGDKWEVFPRKDVTSNKQTQITCDDIEENFRDMCKDKLEGIQEVLGGAYIPAGQSFKCLVHLYQISKTGKMRYFDHGTPEANEKLYGSPEPPSYIDDLKNVIAPTLIWTSENDGLVMPEDTDSLKPHLSNLVAFNNIPDECFDHATYIFPRKSECLPVRQKLYDDMIEALQKLDN